MKKLTRFLYNGIYYPVFGSSALFGNNKYRNVYQQRVGGYGDNYGKWWTFNWGIKCRVWNQDKPYRQKIIDTIENHPGIKLKREFFGEDEKKEDSMFIVVSNKGDYIGDITTGYQLSSLEDFRTYGEDSNTVCHAYDVYGQKACGWSHRATMCFGKGDKIFQELDQDGVPYSDDTGFTKHGHRTIKTYEDAMQSALNFATYVA